MNIYTNVQVFGDNILVRGIQNSKKFKQKVKYRPFIFVESQNGTFDTLDGRKVEKISPGSIKETKDFINQSVENMKLYGLSRFEYQFINRDYSEHIDWSINYITIFNIDIEVASRGGYASSDNPWQPITAITIKSKDNIYVWGCKDFETKDSKIRYFKCFDENALLKSFVNFWSQNCPDIITGWNIKYFDIPYLINRITRLFGEEEAVLLSPWKHIMKKVSRFMNKEQISYSLYGIATIDYIELYRKFAKNGNSQESYTLDNIAFVEMNERKTDYSEYDNLDDLYEKNYQLYIEYNIQDVCLVDKLENKLKLIELLITIAYDAKVNYEDVFSQVRMWTVMINNFLLKRNIACPMRDSSSSHEDYSGGYVKDPQTGFARWIVGFDLTSLYPHLIMQYNISPDRIINHLNNDLSSILSQNVSVDRLLRQEIDLTLLVSNNVTITPNGQFFDVRTKGFLSEMMEEMFNDRKRYKNEQLKAEKEREEAINESEKSILSNKIARFANLQMAKKVCLNSAYGALGNVHFFLYDVRQASAITLSGQLSIRWIGNAINSYLNKLLNTNGIDYVIASDTDSCYVTFERLVNSVFSKEDQEQDPRKIIRFLHTICVKKILPFIESKYEELGKYLNVFAQKMEMKREAIADVGIWTAKKRYILNVWDNEGVEYKEPKIKISGLDAIRSTTPTVCRKKLKEAIEIIIRKDEATLQAFVAKFRSDFEKYPLKDIAFPKSVNGIEKYSSVNKDILFEKKTPIHVRGTIVYNNLLKQHNLSDKYEAIKEGEKIKYIYLKTPNIIHSDIISFTGSPPKELDIESIIDYNLQFEKSFISPLCIILDAINWKHEKTLNIEDFFG